jgi:membrane protein
MKMTGKIFLHILKTAIKAWWAKDPFRQSAIISYYAIFALPGLFLVILALAGYFFGKDAVNNQVVERFSDLLGVDTAEQIQSIILQSSASKNSFFAAVIGIFIMIVGATSVFAQFQKSLNIIWNVQVDKSKSSILEFLKVRLFSFGIIVTISFLLIISLIISALLSAFGNWLSGHFPDSLLVLIQIINFFISFIIVTVLFALMYKFLPDTKIKWTHVWIGSIVTTLLFELGKYGLGLYFGKANPGLGYGAASSIILIMLWVSYTSMIVFYGAEFTKAYADIYSENAISGKIGLKKSKIKKNNK